MKKGEKRCSSGRFAPYSTSGTESDIAGAGCETSLNHTITWRSRNAIFLQYARNSSAPDKSSDHAILQVAIQSRIKLFWLLAALRKKAGEKVELQLQVSQQGNQLTLKNPTAYYLTIAYLGEMKKAFSRLQNRDGCTF